jgi:LmbE family N-acetylglucosaminyl deacetylase
MFIDGARSVLAFGAHPDDLEAGAGGLLAKLVGAGAHVTMVVTSIPNRFDERIAEARAGAAVLGAELLLLRDDAASRVEDYAMWQLVERYDAIVDRVKPDLVIAHGPEDTHWDHYLVHRAVVSAMRRQRASLLAYSAGSAPAATMGTCFADISAHIDAKLDALGKHATQFSAAKLEAMRDRARGAGVQCGVRYAEVFTPLRVYL